MASLVGYFLMEFVIDDYGGTSLTGNDSWDDLAKVLQVATVAAITEVICVPFDNRIIALSALFT
jgi:hypothetical protein